MFFCQAVSYKADNARLRAENTDLQENVKGDHDDQSEYIAQLERTIQQHKLKHSKQLMKMQEKHDEEVVVRRSVGIMKGRGKTGICKACFKLTLCMLGNLSSAKMLSAEFLKLAFSLNFAKNTIRKANSLDPDETPRSVASHLDPNCLQRPSKFGSSTERFKVHK
ncbi:hypothetical protein DPMN_107103 [Dreissena polymorpha]|uniref:Uncharacterized protein n=1 Tax=Dreissena polymorpha TaxID=45954 RepID=A0A9D4K6I7_DREPO|nr:hypothetical protein DPMN_107103 [Dreissena polymorpha]